MEHFERNKMKQKTDFPQTKLQEQIADFWSVRGYSKVTAVLGNLSVSFHKENPLHEQNGLCYQYLEQFWLEAKKEVFEDIELLARTLAGDFGETPIRKEYVELKKKHLKGSFDNLLKELKNETKK